jgi:anti-sigma regulatory factor (Ser/Thr protein kinase)
MTMVCRIESRFPVAVAALYGTLDYSAAIETAVTLHGCLAERPVQLVLDLAHLQVPEHSALRPLASLADGARRWPGSRVAVSGASRPVREQLHALTVDGTLDFYPSAAEAVAAGQQLPVPVQETVELSPNQDAPAAGREMVAAACRRWRLDRWSRLTQLLTSELVTNAVVHARTPIWLTLRRLGDTLQVAVRDRDPRLVEQPPRGPAGLPVGEPGRGLLLLATLAADWGSAPTSDGKVTWANVTLSQDPSAAHPAGQPADRPPPAGPHGA